MIHEPEIKFFSNLISAPKSDTLGQNLHHLSQNLTSSVFNYGHNQVTFAPGSNTHYDRMEPSPRQQSNADGTLIPGGQLDAHRIPPQERSNGTDTFGKPLIGTGTMLAGSGITPGLAASATTGAKAGANQLPTLLESIQDEQTLEGALGLGKKKTTSFNV